MTVSFRHRLSSIMRRAHKAARRLRAHFASYRDAIAFALRRIYAEASARAYLAKNAGRDLLARFVKADGSVRVMRFVYEGDRSRQSDGCIRVWDLERARLAHDQSRHVRVHPPGRRAARGGTLGASGVTDGRSALSLGEATHARQPIFDHCDAEWRRSRLITNG